MYRRSPVHLARLRNVAIFNWKTKARVRLEIPAVRHSVDQIFRSLTRLNEQDGSLIGRTLLQWWIFGKYAMHDGSLHFLMHAAASWSPPEF